MTRTRMMIVAFWVVIIGLGLWQCADYNKTLTKDAVENPPQHYFFYNTNSTKAPVAPTTAHREGAEVIQTAFEIQRNTPSSGSFTCRVTLKNVGTAKAVGVQIKVRPYKGISLGDEDGGHARPGQLKETTAESQIGQWVSFPDLAPGESAYETAVFLTRDDMSPGTNPQPDILFDTEKPKAAPAETPHLPPKKSPVD